MAPLLKVRGGGSVCIYCMVWYDFSEPNEIIQSLNNYTYNSTSIYEFL